MGRYYYRGILLGGRERLDHAASDVEVEAFDLSSASNGGAGTMVMLTTGTPRRSTRYGLR